MPTLLVTRGDDFGSFPEADRAIADAHDRGCLRNASIMAPAPSFAHAAALARSRPSLCVGLHVTVTCEWRATRWGPLADPASVPSLIGADGTFLPTTMALFERGVRLDELEREARLQLAVARAAGVPIAYLDEHMGVGWLHEPGRPEERFADRLRALAREQGLLWHADVAPPDRSFHERIAPFPVPPTTDGVRSALAGLEDGVWLWMTHPAYAGGMLERERTHDASDAPGLQARVRAADASVLQDPRVIAACAQRGVRPASYVEVAAVAAA